MLSRFEPWSGSHCYIKDYSTFTNYKKVILLQCYCNTEKTRVSPGHFFIYYTFSCFLGFLTLYIVSIIFKAKFSISSVTLTYKSIVVVILLCPNICCNTLIFPPLSIKLVAKVCLVSWKVISGKLFSLIIDLNSLNI